MTDEQKKYLKAAVMAAATSAGVAAVARSMKAKKDRAKAQDVQSSRNAIVIPVKKSRFMEGVRTPEEQRAETQGASIAASRPVRPAMLAAPGDETPALASADASAEDIEAKKRQILRSLGRKMDFFSKRAAETHEDKESGGNDAKNCGDDGEKRVVLRDGSGKFVSPTDPVGVADAEKSAGYDWGKGALRFVTGPFETLGRVFSAAGKTPVYMTAGAIGSIYLAAKISDAINARRKERAKKRLDEARDEYVGILQGDEKKAQAQPAEKAVGNVLGASFVVPAALAAIVTAKILENRRAEKRREKDMSDSYPEEPVILYKTSEAKDIRISPETALAAMIVKQAIFEHDEREMAGLAMDKEAAWWTPWGAFKDVTGYKGNTMNSAVTDAVKFLGDEANSNEVLDLIKAYAGESGTSNGADAEAVDKAYGSLMGKMSLSDKFKNWFKGNVDYAKDPRFRSAVMANPQFQDMMVQRFTNDPRYRAYRDQLIDNRISSWRLEKGGILHSILSWIAKNTGIGGMMFNSRLKDMMRGGYSPVDQTRPAQQTQGDVSQGTQLDPTRIGGLDASQYTPPPASATPASVPATELAPGVAVPGSKNSNTKPEPPFNPHG